MGICWASVTPLAPQNFPDFLYQPSRPLNSLEVLHQLRGTVLLEKARIVNIWDQFFLSTLHTECKTSYLYCLLSICDMAAILHYSKTLLIASLFERHNSYFIVTHSNGIPDQKMLSERAVKESGILTKNNPRTIMMAVRIEEYVEVNVGHTILRP